MERITATRRQLQRASSPLTYGPGKVVRDDFKSPYLGDVDFGSGISISLAKTGVPVSYSSIRLEVGGGPELGEKRLQELAMKYVAAFEPKLGGVTEGRFSKGIYWKTNDGVWYRYFHPKIKTELVGPGGLAQIHLIPQTGDCKYVGVAPMFDFENTPKRRLTPSQALDAAILETFRTCSTRQVSMMAEPIPWVTSTGTADYYVLDNKNPICARMRDRNIGEPTFQVVVRHDDEIHQGSNSSAPFSTFLVSATNGSILGRFEGSSGAPFDSVAPADTIVLKDARFLRNGKWVRKPLIKFSAIDESAQLKFDACVILAKNSAVNCSINYASKEARIGNKTYRVEGLD